MKEAAYPCPFCGSGDIRIMGPTCTKDAPYDPSDRAYPVAICAGCRAEACGDNWDKGGMSALNAWNRRIDIATVEGAAPDLLRSLKKLHGILHEAFPALRHDSTMQAAALAIGRAEGRNP